MKQVLVLWQSSMYFRAITLLMAGLLLFSVLQKDAHAQVASSTFSQLVTYVGKLAGIVNDHDVKVKQLEAQVAAQHDHINKVNVYLRDMTCKYNGLVKGLANNVPITYTEPPPPFRACPDNTKAAPEIPPLLQ